MATVLEIPNSTFQNGNQRKRKNHYTTVNMAPCKICGGKSTGYHFGAITCEACKAFFRRAISKDSYKNYKCQRDGACGLVPSNITTCSACRLARCMQLNMSKKGVRRGRYSIELRTKSILEAKREQRKTELLKASTETMLLDDIPENDQCQLDAVNDAFTDQAVDFSSTSNHMTDMTSSSSSSPSSLDEYSTTHTFTNSFSKPERTMSLLQSPLVNSTCGMPNSSHTMESRDNNINWRGTNSNIYLEVNGDSNGNSVPVNNKRSDSFLNLKYKIGKHDNGYCLANGHRQDSDSTRRNMAVTNGYHAVRANGFSTIGDLSAIGACQMNTEDAYFDGIIKRLVELQGMLYPHHKITDDIFKEQKRIQTEHESREEAYKFMFGSSNVVSNTEFKEVMSQVNIELDDRLIPLREKAKATEKNICMYIQHSKYIPDFNTLDKDDVTLLLKAAYCEFWLFSNFAMINSQTETSGGSDGVLNAHKKVANIFFPIEYVEAVFEFSATLKKMEFSIQEVAIIRVILLTFTDRVQLKHPEKVEHLQTIFVRCLRYHLSKTTPNPARRFCKIMDKMVNSRTLLHLNAGVNRAFLKEWGFFMDDFPLWLEMMNFSFTKIHALQ